GFLRFVCRTCLCSQAISYPKQLGVTYRMSALRGKADMAARPPLAYRPVAIADIRGPLLLRCTTPNCSNICYTWAVTLGRGVSPGRRRDFTPLLGSSVAGWPLAARAQQPPMPVVGFLHPSSPEPFRVRAFRQGLKDAGFIEGENVAVEYRWADDQI